MFATLLFLSVGMAAAVDSVFLKSVDWLEDPSGQMTLAEAQASGSLEKLDSTIFAQGFNLSALWFRLHIDPGNTSPTDAEENLVLRIQPSYHDDIRLYDPLNTSGKLRITGDKHPWSEGDLSFRDLHFRIPRGDAPRDIWLRLQTHNSTLAIFEVFSEHELEIQERRMDVVIILYCSVLFLCVGWGISNWQLHRDKLSGAYVIRGVFAIFYSLAYLGYLRIILSDDIIAAGYDFDALSNLIMWTFVATAIYFDWRLLSECKPNRFLLALLGLCPWILLPEVGLLLLGDVTTSIRLNNLAVMLASTLIFPIALSSKGWSNADRRTQPPFPKALVLSTYFLVFVTILTQRIASAGWWALDHRAVIYIQFLYPVVTSLVMVVMLKVRSDSVQERNRENQHQLLRAQQQADDERVQRVEQERFLSMLVHELKTPIGVAQLNLEFLPQGGEERGRIAKALLNMNSIIERCRISNAVENKRLHLDLQEVNVREAVFECIDQLLEIQRVKVFEGMDCFVTSDFQLVSIVLSNLLDNALKYSPNESEITVRIANQVGDGKSGVTVVITNLVGQAGLPDETQVFTKYYRAKAAESKSGSGLGLHLSEGISALLGGHLRYRSEAGKAEFSLWLPS